MRRQSKVSGVLDGESPIAKVAVRPRALNPTCFLNAAACRGFLLEQAAGARYHKFERVSGKTLRRINEQVRMIMVSVIRQLPSKGKTI